MNIQQISEKARLAVIQYGTGLFEMNEESLRGTHLATGEAMQESESLQERNALELQAKMIDAIGRWRFENWGDGLPVEG